MNKFMSNFVCEGFTSCSAEILSWKCWNAKKKLWWHHTLVLYCLCDTWNKQAMKTHPSSQTVRYIHGLHRNRWLHLKNTQVKKTKQRKTKQNKPKRKTKEKQIKQKNTNNSLVLRIQFLQKKDFKTQLLCFVVVVCCFFWQKYQHFKKLPQYSFKETHCLLSN